MDQVKNFCIYPVLGTLASGINSITIDSADSSKLPTPPYNLVIFDSQNYPDPALDPNVEIVRVTNQSFPTLTISRAQEGTVERNHTGTLKVIQSFTRATYEGAYQEFPTDINRYGFIPSETNISFSGTTFTLSPTGTTWSYYLAGKKYTITGSKTVTVASGLNFIYINNNTEGNLTASTSTPWDLTPTDTKVPVATLYYNSSLSPTYIKCDERHTCGMDRAWHREHHFTEGTELSSGFSIPTLSTGVDTNPGKTFSISQTKITDEDLFFTLDALTNTSGVTPNYSIVYHSGSTTNYVWSLSDMPFPYISGGAIQYDTTTALATPSNGYYVNSFLVATNAVGPNNSTSQFRFCIIPGQQQYATAALAYNEDFKTLILPNFPVAEFVTGWQFTWKYNSNRTSKGLCVLDKQTPLRVSYVATTVSSPTTDHNGLANLQGGVSATSEFYHLDQTRYTYLSGVTSDVQTQINNKVSSQWTSSSSNIYYSTGNVSIGTTPNSSPLQVKGAPWFHALTSGASQINLRLGEFVDDQTNSSLFDFLTDDATGDYLNIRSNRYNGTIQFTHNSPTGYQRHIELQGAPTVAGTVRLYNLPASAETVVLTGSGNSYFNGGNVGIGTTNPANLLHLYSAEPRIQWSRTATGDTLLNGTWAGMDATGFYILERDNTSIRFYTNAVERFRIDNSGNIGIGTTPAGLLHLRKTTGPANLFMDTLTASGYSAQLLFRDDTTSKWAIAGGNAGSAAVNDFSIYNYAASANSITITSGNNVGIGTGSPRSVLDVVAASDATLQFTKYGANVGELKFTSTSNSNIHARYTAYTHKFMSNNGTDSIYVTNLGKVGIDNTTPTAALTVKGDTNYAGLFGLNAESGYGLFLHSETGAEHKNWKLTTQDTINDAFEISPSTTSGVTTWASPVFYINSSGNATITGSLTSQGLTASKVLVSDGSKVISSSSITSTELLTLSGIQSNIQSQINGKQAAGSYLTSITVTTNSGVSATSTGGTTPALSFALGAITPTSVNGLTLSSPSKSLTVLNTITLSGTDGAIITLPAGTKTLVATDGSISGTAGGLSSTLSPASGGTGVANNSASTLTINGNYATTVTVSGITGITLPQTGILLSNTSPTTLFPTLDQNTAGSAAKWTTARNLAGNSVDGSANVNFSNKFIIQTADAGLPNAQVLSGLSTGVLKNTNGTGVLSIATASDFPTAVPSKGGTGIANNDASTLTINGNFATTLTVSAATSLTLPTTGTVLATGNYLVLDDTNFNTGLGFGTHKTTITGAAYNSYFGYLTGSGNTMTNAADYNSGFGYAALKVITSASNNTAIGAQSMLALTIGTDNVGVGYNTMQATTSGLFNVGVGSSALYSNIGGRYNTAVGSYALYGINNIIANSNTALGSDAGRTITNGSNNTFLGYQAGYNASQLASAKNSIAIGNGTWTTADNTIIIGNTSITDTDIRGDLNIGVSGVRTAQIDMRGTTSGVISIKPADAAGTWTMTLPTSAGTDGHFLKTNGTGTLSWAAASAGGDPSFTATVNDSSGSVTAGDFVNIYSDSGTIKVRKACASSGTQYEANGYVKATVSNSSTATVYLIGVNDQRSSLTVGSVYYLSTTAGAVTSTAPTGNNELRQYLGKALTSTTMMVRIGEPITLTV